MDWRKVYKLPFKYDDYNYVCVWADNGTMTLTFDIDYCEENKRDIIMKVVNKLNGDSSIKFKKKFELEEIEFYYDNEFVFTIRGWGHLTGVLKLSEIEAEKTQDDFALWILETLNS
jgi:hypothetical protein